jgi:hypothetical protein
MKTTTNSAKTTSTATAPYFTPLKAAQATLLLFGAALVAAAASTAAHAATQPYTTQTTMVCIDGSQSTDKNGCDKRGGVKAIQSVMTPTDTMAVETESAKVSATGDAPTTGGASRTPGRPDPLAR